MEDDKTMEDLFREILASPKSTNAPLLSVADSSSTEMMFGPGVSGEGVDEEVKGAEEEEEEEEKTLDSAVTETGADDTTAVDWANEIEMQSILDTMMTVSSSGGEDSQFDIGLGLEFVIPENTLGLANSGFDMDFASIVGPGLAGQSWDTGVF